MAVLAPMPVGAASRGGAVVAASVAKAAAPSVTAVTRSGPTSGGNTVTVRGAGFAAGAVVTFDGAAGTRVRVLSTTRLTVAAPARTPATVDVQVRTTAGISAVTAASRYTYVPVPVQRLSYSAVRATSVSLAWQNPRVSPGFARITVRRLAGTIAPATPSQGTLVATLPRWANTFTDTGLTANTAYSYAVFAKAGVFSAPAKITARTTVTGFRVAATIPFPADASSAMTNDGFNGPTLDCPVAGWCLTTTVYQRAGGTAVAARVLADGVWTATRFGPSVTSASGSFLYVADFSCRDRGSCLAAITTVSNARDDATFTDQLWQLDGNTWSLLPTPRPAQAASGLAAGVSQVDCIPGSDCVLLGEYQVSDLVGHRFTARWNGSAFSTRALPDLTIGTVPAYSWDLACRTATSCIAAGIAFEGGSITVTGSAAPSAASTTRSSTSTAHQPDAGAMVLLPGSSTRAPRVVPVTVAERIVGAATVRREMRRQGAARAAESAARKAAQAAPVSVLFRLEPAAWTVTALPLPKTADPNNLVFPELRCADTYCLAFGTYRRTDGRARSLAVFTTGTAGWTSREPLPIANGDVGIVDGTCIGNTCIVAAAASTWDGTDVDVMATTTGGAWTRRAAPIPDEYPMEYQVQSVGCRSTILCVLTGAGYNYETDEVQSFLLLAPTPGKPAPIALPTVSAAVATGADTYLGSVTCSSARDCVAIGFYGDQWTGDGGVYSVAIRFDTAG